MTTLERVVKYTVTQPNDLEALKNVPFSGNLLLDLGPPPPLEVI